METTVKCSVCLFNLIQYFLSETPRARLTGVGPATNKHVGWKLKDDVMIRRTMAGPEEQHPLMQLSPSGLKNQHKRPGSRSPASVDSKA